MRNSEQIGKYIKQLRKTNNISVTALAEKVGINKSTLSRYENGSRKIPMEDIANFANALGVTPENILFEEKQDDTIAAHLEDDDFTEDELKKIRDFADIVRKARKG